MEMAANSISTISPGDALALMRAGNVLIVDVREASELQVTGKIVGAVHVPGGMLEIRADPESPHHDPAFDRDKTVLIYCASGGRSALACKMLQGLGYKDVRNLGGFRDWLECGGPVEKA
jgi:rhodanese-related sulfurtransferase